jgi:predicted AlkP superfamily pyrophosphatase or phosphodiesterase
MRRVLVLDVVGLTPGLVGDDAPCLAALAKRGGARPLAPVLPAVTCPVQASMLTGGLPRDHGIVGNGWYFRDLSEVWLWRQSNRLVDGEMVWEAARKRDPAFRCAKLFWWFNMYASADVTVTPRPMYPADGRKIPDLYTRPAELRGELQRALGAFPLFQFWGPTADATSSRWIARAALEVERRFTPTLSLVYLPHLDYDLQRFGPHDPRSRRALAEIDAIAGELVEHAERAGMRVLVLSEYGITAVRGAVHPNRALREAGLLTVRGELGRELLDPGASEAFAVADHQVAHVYVRRPERVADVQRLLEGLDGVDQVLGGAEKAAAGLDHPRAGELVLVARPDRWFSYYYWLDDERAPDFARTVDIHRKPGYDPVELFLDPKLRLPRLGVGWRLLKKAMGFRTLMDVIALDADLVRGSHGRLGGPPDEGPIVISSEPELLPAGPVPATAVKELVLRHVFD